MASDLAYPADEVENIPARGVGLVFIAFRSTTAVKSAGDLPTCLYGPLMGAMPEIVHYIDVAIRIRFALEQRKQMLQVARKLRQETVAIQPDKDDPDAKGARRMTDSEGADEVTCVQDTIEEILHAHPLFKQLGMEIIGTHTGLEATVADINRTRMVSLSDSRRSEPKRRPMQTGHKRHDDKQVNTPV